MGKKEEFKEFVKKNPSLLKHIKDGSMTWQKFYEIYDLYGNSGDAWKDYTAGDRTVKAAAAATTGFGLAEIFNYVKQMDLNTVQNGINSLQRVVGVFQDLGSKDQTSTPKQEYKPRPLYKHFDD